MGGTGAISSTFDKTLETVRPVRRRRFDLDASDASTMPVGLSLSGAQAARMDTVGKDNV